MCAPSRFLINKRDICLQLSRLFRRFSMSVSDLRFGFPSTSQLSPRFSFPFSVSRFPSTSQLPQRSTSQLSQFQLSVFRFPLWVSPQPLNCLNAQRLNSLSFSFPFSVFRFGFSPQRL